MDAKDESQKSESTEEEARAEKPVETKEPLTQRVVPLAGTKRIIERSGVTKNNSKKANKNRRKMARKTRQKQRRSGK